MSASLGACNANADNLTHSGIATVTWTADGSGGGVLSVSVPKGPECTTPPGDSSDPHSWDLTLSLLRPRAGKSFRFTVAGQGNGFYSGGTGINIGGFTFMFSPGSATFCGPAQDLVVTSGTNPVDLTTVCCGPGFLNVSASGYSTGSEEYAFTVTVEAL